MARPSVLALVATRAHAVLAATVAMAPVAPVATAPTMAATVATRQAVALVQTVATTAPVLVVVAPALVVPAPAPVGVAMALAPVLEQVLAPALALATAPVKFLALALVVAVTVMVTATAMVNPVSLGHAWTASLVMAMPSFAPSLRSNTSALADFLITRPLNLTSTTKKKVRRASRPKTCPATKKKAWLIASARPMPSAVVSASET